MFILKNKAGAELRLTGNPLFDLSHIEGLTKYAGNLSSSTSAVADGDTVTNAQALPRDIVLDLTIKDGVNVQNALDEIKAIVKPKEEISLFWNDKTISGVVSDMDAPRFSKGVVLQISLHCSDPWWQDVQRVITEIAESISLAHFTMSFLINDEGNVESLPLGEIDLNRTKSFNNDGDVAVGMDISIVAVGDVVNPSLRRNNGDFIGIFNGAHFAAFVAVPGDSFQSGTELKKMVLIFVEAVGKCSILLLFQRLAVEVDGEPWYEDRCKVVSMFGGINPCAVEKVTHSLCGGFNDFHGVWSAGNRAKNGLYKVLGLASVGGFP